MRLKGAVSIITGGTQGIGLVTVATEDASCIGGAAIEVAGGLTV